LQAGLLRFSADAFDEAQTDRREHVIALLGGAIFSFTSGDSEDQQQYENCAFHTHSPTD
jgi:hypothetical protein